MWFHLSLFLLLGAVVADHRYAWLTRYQYQFLVQSRTLASLENTKNVTGIQLKGVLTVQVESLDTLIATLTNPQYARVNTELSEDWETLIPDETLQYREYPLTGLPFQIKLREGLIQELLFERDVPTSEVNFLKSVVSQLQIDTQAKNVLINGETLMPNDDQSLGTYKVMEASVGGECEVLYDIKLSDDEQSTMKFEPLLNSTAARQFIEIKKLKNYNKCKQQRDRSYGFGDRANLKSSNDEYNDKVSTKLSTNRIIIYGNLKRFTIYFSVMRNNIYVKSTENQNLGTVHSQITLALSDLGDEYETIDINLKKLRSTGNLVYTDSGPLLPENEYGSQSSSEENQYRNNQGSIDNSNKSKLNAIPSSLMMSFLNDYKNRDVKLIDHFSSTEAAYQKILQIANEVEQPDDLPFHETLEKYAILVNLLRVLNVDQYVELKQRLNINATQLQRPNLSSGELDDKRSIVRNVFYDAVGQSGTEPALLAVIDWLKSENFSIIETIQLITQISNGVRVPTAEYVKHFFDLISHSSILRRRYLNRIAPVAFAELVSKSSKLVNLNNDITEIYIPYFKRALADAFRRDDSLLVQTYIKALGSIGDSKILSVFESYLEDQKRVTKYERMLIVRSLYQLAVTDPKAVRNVLYKIYLNVNEAYEVRAVAVYLYLLTNPSLSALIRMAKFTNSDKSEQVNSAVKSGIISLSKVNRPDLHLLIENARVARKLLTLKSYDLTYSQIYFTDKSILVTIASEDSDVPKLAIYNANNFYNPKDPAQQLEYALSNVDLLLKNFEKQERNLEEGKNSLVEKLVEQLNVKFGVLEKLKGNVFLSSPYGKIFSSFDKKDILTFIKWLGKEKTHVDFNHFYIYDKIVSSPTESGLLFSYAEEVPALVKIHATKNGGLGIAENGNIFLQINGEFNAVVSGKVQRRFGFSVPSDRQYQVGIDTKLQVNLPIEYEYIQTIEQNSEQNYELRLQPTRNARIRLLHYSTAPFSTQRADFDFQPVSSLNLTNIINLPTQGSLSYQIGTIYVGGELNATLPNKFLNLASQIKNIINNPNLLLNGKFDVYIDNEEETKNNELYLNVHYKQQESIVNDQNKYLVSSIHDIKDKKPNSKERQNQILQEVSKHFKSVKARVYDVSLEISSLDPQKIQVFTVGLGKSYIDSKSRIVLYWNRQSKEDKEIQSEGLITADLRSLSDARVHRNLNEALKQTPLSKFMINMLIGDKNEIINKIQIKGNFTQSDSLRKMIMNSKVARQCWEQIRQGNDRSEQGQEAIQNAQIKDNLKLLITNSEYYKLYTDMALEYLSDIISSKSVKLGNLKNDNTIDLELNISPNYRKAKVSVNTPKINVPFIAPTSSGGLDNSLKKENEVNDARTWLDSSHCLVKRSQVSTFDGNSYDTNMLNNWQIMMIPVVETGLPENMKAAVMMRRTKDNRIQTLLILNNHKITLKKSNGTVTASIDQNDEIVFPLHTNYVFKDQSETVVEITDTLQNLIWVFAPKYGLFLAYNEYYVDIQLPNRYRNKIRGLCGNYDRRGRNDLLTPDNCIMQDPNEFIATYTLADNNDPTNILYKKWNTSSNCLGENYLLTNVISDREAGRLTSKPVWGYHTDRTQSENLKKNAQENLRKNTTLTPIDRSIVEEYFAEICFSLEPVPTCRYSEVALHTKLKEIAFNCMPKNAIARKLQWRIEQGANPNLSDKSVSKKENREVPIVCTVTN